jgi:parvulin-like peptidyl-prolyl isomerase
MPPPQVKGVFSLYAASSGQAARDRLADDDRNPNSVFSRVLVPSLTRPGIDLATLAIEVREEVARIAQTAGYEQQPAYYDETIGGRVYLAGAPPANSGGVSVMQAGPAGDEGAWGILKDTKDAELLRRFVAQYPGSPRRHEAEERLKGLEEVRVRHILFRVGSQSDQAVERKVNAVIERLKKGEDFAKLATALTEDPSGKADGGDLGYFTRDKMVPEFSDAAFSLEKGQISTVKTMFGWHVIKVEDKR